MYIKKSSSSLRANAGTFIATWEKKIGPYFFPRFLSSSFVVCADDDDAFNRGGKNGKQKNSPDPNT